MYRIERKPYGVRLTMAGSMSVEEARGWLEESYTVVPRLGGEFSVFVELLCLETTSAEVRAVMMEGQRYYRRWGMRRSVVIVSSEKQAMEFRRIALESGIYEWERYVSAEATPDWEEVGLAWIEHGTDPDRTREGQEHRERANTDKTMDPAPGTTSLTWGK